MKKCINTCWLQGRCNSANRSQGEHKVWPFPFIHVHQTVAVLGQLAYSQAHFHDNDFRQLQLTSVASPP